MPRPPLLRSIRLALGLGTVIGAVLGVWSFVSMWGWRWAPAGAIGGAIFGFISGFDALIPGPGRDLRPRRGNRVGPFRGGTMLAIGSVCLFVGGFYARGHVELRCARGEASEVACRRSYHGWLGRAVTSEETWAEVTGVWDGGPSRIVLILASGERGIVEGFGPEYLEPIDRWLRSSEPLLSFRSDVFDFFSPLFFVLAVVVGALAVQQLRRGIRMLRAQIESGAVA